MESIINIGVSLQTLKEARATILEVLHLKEEGSVKVAAFDALTKICSVNGTSISGCTFTGTPSGKVKVKKRRAKPNGA